MPLFLGHWLDVFLRIRRTYEAIFWAYKKCVFIHRGRWNGVRLPSPHYVDFQVNWGIQLHCIGGTWFQAECVFKLSKFPISSSCTSFLLFVSFTCSVSCSLLLTNTTLLSWTTWQRISSVKTSQWFIFFFCDPVKKSLTSLSSLAEVFSSWERSTELEA